MPPVYLSTDLFSFCATYSLYLITFHLAPGGSYDNPDFGCGDERSDAAAAYIHALLYTATGNESHAKKSMEIMDAWSSVMKMHNNTNAPLQSGWVGSVFPRAAEIIKSVSGISAWKVKI